MDKSEVRQNLQRKLYEISEQERAVRSRAACRKLVRTEEFQQASVIMIFLSLPHEVDTAEAILSAWQADKIVAVPKISWQQRHMIPVKINSLETGFSMGASGLRNPVTGVPVPFESIDMVITPALGYDRQGNRIGRGGSYYDRFFQSNLLKAVRCGFGFAEQVIDKVPVLDHDQAMDMVVTDEEVIYCK